MVTAARRLALEKRLHRRLVGFDKTVHLEKVSYTETDNPYSANTPVTTFSVLITPTPLIREYIPRQEDVSDDGLNLTLGDFVFEVTGDAVTETQLKQANILVLNKGLASEVKLEIRNFAIAAFQDSEFSEILAITGGAVIKWKIVARGQVTNN